MKLLIISRSIWVIIFSIIWYVFFKEIIEIFEKNEWCNNYSLSPKDHKKICKFNN